VPISFATKAFIGHYALPANDQLAIDWLIRPQRSLPVAASLIMVASSLTSRLARLFFSHRALGEGASRLDED